MSRRKLGAWCECMWIYCFFFGIICRWSKYRYAKHNRPSSSKLSWHPNLEWTAIYIDIPSFQYIIPISFNISNPKLLALLKVRIAHRCWTWDAYCLGLLVSTSYQHHIHLNFLRWITFKKNTSLYIHFWKWWQPQIAFFKWTSKGHVWRKTISFSWVPGTSTLISEIMLNNAKICQISSFCIHA